jgi:hypothetical protein
MDPAGNDVQLDNVNSEAKDSRLANSDSKESSEEDEKVNNIIPKKVLHDYNTQKRSRIC